MFIRTTKRNFEKFAKLCFDKGLDVSRPLITKILNDIQGGAVNRGLFFADPPLSLLGAVSGKISEIR